MAAATNLALFDLDNTLLAGDSDFEWAQFLIEQGVLDREVYEARNQQFYDQYKAGTLDIHEFLDFQLKPLSRHPRRVLDEWHRLYMRRKILPMIRAFRPDAILLQTGADGLEEDPLAKLSLSNNAYFEAARARGGRSCSSRTCRSPLTGASGARP